MRKLTRSEFKIMKIFWTYPENYFTTSNMLRYIEDWKGDQGDFEAVISKLFRDGFIKQRFYDGTLANGMQSKVSEEDYRKWLEEHGGTGMKNAIAGFYSVYNEHPTDQVAEQMARAFVNMSSGLELDEMKLYVDEVRELFKKHPTDEMANQLMKGMANLAEKQAEYDNE